MFERIRRALKTAAYQPATASGSPRSRMRYHWRCACGAHSRPPGSLIPSDAEHLAQRHRLNQRGEHPAPALYSIEELEEDFV